MGDPPTRSLVFGSVFATLSNRHPSQNSSLVPSTSRSHIVISTCTTSSAVFVCLVFIIIALHKRVLKEYINYVY
ncbi:hypothetical protein BYT27DRAFT_7183256 [Phlegmacium glaucopus]|nr:hypothetical protein BYT27DRAFT_7183256 [Phlegmacium glaucopus]